MGTPVEKQRLSNGQLIFVPHKDTIRLLEVFVKRSLSVNDGAATEKRKDWKLKWVMKKTRRHSSDPSLHLAEGFDDIKPELFSPGSPFPGELEPCHEESEKENKKPKKDKKPSFWKNIFGIFTRKNDEDKDDEHDGPTESSKEWSSDMSSDPAKTCLPTTPASSQKKATRRKSLKRRLSKRRLSLLKPSKPVPADISEFEAVMSVEPTYAYYEKVSEEMEKIVNEVKEKEEDQRLSDEEVINRIIALTKVEGDAIEDKLKENTTLSNFFKGMTYSSFQKLADAYLEEEASPSHNPPTVLPTAPELVKLAFTLDFTARMASLSRQNIGHITSLGNRYLQDRFEYKQACSDRPFFDSADATT